LAAIFGGYLLLRGQTLVAVAFCVVPLIIWLFAQPRPALIVLGASIPITYSLTGGRGGFNLSPSDLLLVFVAAGILFRAAITDSLPAIRALKPIAPAVVQYGFFMLLLLAVHLSVSDFAKTGQRFELFLLPLMVGAFAALTSRHVALLKGYVVSATLLAALWPVAHSLGQKNPVAQMIANAILLLVGVRALRRYLPSLVVLVPGLVLTASRGAIVATAIGLAVIVAFQNSRARTVIARAAVLAVLAFGTYATLPPALQNRLTTFTPGVGSRGAYALYVRQQYARDAEHIIKAHAWAGIGVGNYLAGNPSKNTQTRDPHDVLLLQAAEGGYAFAVSFVLLLAGSIIALRRMSQVDIAAAAAAVLCATAVHGLFDIYWVRATPVLGWLLVGMVCGGFIKLRQHAAEVPPS
jgi:hypothetical protein